jgi:hypothetical protein
MADDEPDVDSQDEGLQLLLGGLAVSAVSPESWHEEEDLKQRPPSQGADVRVRNNASGTPQEREITRNIPLVNMKDLAEEETHGCYDRAFHCTTNGQLIRPPARIVDMVCNVWPTRTTLWIVKCFDLFALFCAVVQ